MNPACVAWALPGRAPGVALGRSQQLPPEPSPLPVRRRSSGGGAVLEGPWLLRSAVRLPRAWIGSRAGPSELARWFGKVHLQWLQQRGVPGAALYRGGTHDHWACFAGRSAGEVLVAGRKLTGIAQAWRRSGVFITAGTLLFAPPWPRLCETLGRSASEAEDLARAATDLEECLGRRVDAGSWAQSLLMALEAALAEAAASLAPDQCPACSAH